MLKIVFIYNLAKNGKNKKRKETLHEKKVGHRRNGLLQPTYNFNKELIFFMTAMGKWYPS